MISTFRSKRVKLTSLRGSLVAAALCTELNDTETYYPGADLTLIHSVKQHLIHA